MEVFECIKTRRSVRRFEDRPVERETIQKIVDAAIWAPSWKNSQTPRYTVVDKREIIDDIAENGCCDFAFNTKTLKQTPVLIVVSYVKGICGFEKDGSYYRLEIKPSGSLVMDTKTFTSTPAVYEQTPMTAVDLLYLMQEYPDMYLITDTKTTDKAQVQRQFRDLVNIANNIGSPEILSRIIPQLYNKEMLSWIKEIYPFENWIFTLYLYANPNYDDIANFCAANGIDTVTLHIDRAKKENISKLKAKGLKVYAHTVNRYRIFEDALAAGVDGIYTDRIKPYELSWVGLTNSIQTTEQTVTVKGKEAKLTTLAIFGTPYAPLRQMAQLGKRFSAEYKKDAGTLNLTVGKTLTTMGNEMLTDHSGHLVTKKADFKLLIGGKESGIQCFYVDGEVYAPVEQILALVQ